MSKAPSNPSGDGRDSRGRFAKGNPGGPGNPLGGRMEKLRRALLSAITEADIQRAVQSLRKEIEMGNVAAIRELFDRAVGKPVETDIIERLEQLERLLEDLHEHP